MFYSFVGGVVVCFLHYYLHRFKFANFIVTTINDLEKSEILYTLEIKCALKMHYETWIRGVIELEISIKEVYNLKS